MSAGEPVALSGRERHRLALLGLPTFGLALAITVVSTYGPTVARKFTGSTTTIGVIIGAEGVGAILLPVLVGAWSDRLRTGWGGRLPFIAAGGGVLMSLPYALLQPLMPEERHGALTGYYSASRGVGVMLGPLLGGVAIQAGAGILSATEGYAAMWLVCGAASLAAVPLIRRVERRGAS